MQPSLSKLIKSNESASSLPDFPGPAAFYASRQRRLSLIIGAGSFAGLGYGMSLEHGLAGIVGTLGALFFGACALGGIINLLPGASSLKLNGDGFKVTHYFHTQVFRWKDVSGFDTMTTTSPFGTYGITRVVFNEPKPNLRTWDRLNAAMRGGRNGCLPDNYGLAADVLVNLMTSWQNSSDTL